MSTPDNQPKKHPKVLSGLDLHSTEVDVDKSNLSSTPIIPDNQADWQPIPGYEGLYAISMDGEVWTLRRERLRLLAFRVKTGYLEITLIDKDGVKRTYLVHRLVAKVYLPNPDNLPQINHIDGDKLNNRIENLEWCTAKHNTNHAIRLGLMKNRGSDNYATRLTDEDVADIRLFASKGMKFKHIAKAYPVQPQTISNIVKGRTWAAI